MIKLKEICTAVSQDRPRYSTEISLLNITDDWFDAVDKNVIELVMLALKKAFDTVHHEILIENLKSV